MEAITNGLQKQIYFTTNSNVSCIHGTFSQLRAWGFGKKSAILPGMINFPLASMVREPPGMTRLFPICLKHQQPTQLSPKTIRQRTTLVQQQQSPSWHVYMAEEKVRPSEILFVYLTPPMMT